MKTIYTIPSPDSGDSVIEVYGDPDNGWYEWRIVSGKRVVRDSSNMMYGQAEIALRDALMFASNMVGVAND